LALKAIERLEFYGFGGVAKGRERLAEHCRVEQAGPAVEHPVGEKIVPQFVEPGIQCGQPRLGRADAFGHRIALRDASGQPLALVGDRLTFGGRSLRRIAERLQLPEQRLQPGQRLLGQFENRPALGVDNVEHLVDLGGVRRFFRELLLDQ